MRDFNDDDHIDVCQNIEFGLKQAYKNDSSLTDPLCINGLENAKIAIKQQFGYAKNESVTSSEELQGIIDWCVSLGLERIDKVNDLTLKDYVQRIDKIKKSVKRHSEFGRRGYYNFIKEYI